MVGEGEKNQIRSGNGVCVFRCGRRASKRRDGAPVRDCFPGIRLGCAADESSRGFGPARYFSKDHGYPAAGYLQSAAGEGLDARLELSRPADAWSDPAVSSGSGRVIDEVLERPAAGHGGVAGAAFLDGAAAAVLYLRNGAGASTS